MNGKNSIGTKRLPVRPSAPAADLSELIEREFIAARARAVTPMPDESGPGPRNPVCSAFKWLAERQDDATWSLHGASCGDSAISRSKKSGEFREWRLGTFTGHARGLSNTEELGYWPRYFHAADVCHLSVYRP